ncbi:MAG: ABC transporter ATP-binding protein [Pseudanabaenaceae cyanobacterium bins.39]|nr:ABC transporter ATP-binding protein [Pseudanabaenaceae cyanobacterium bins.39]
MSDVVIRVENLSKKYALGKAAKEQSFRDAMTETAKSIGKKLLRSQGESAASDEFWALRDVSFEIKQGDRVGVIGRNGAGKSTLLKILSRITEPSTGRISIKGRVASLLEVGTGFHPELSGRENIFLNGAILGMDIHEIRKKFDEIVAFSEVEKFLDTPVKRYSSGMYVRLAFAVAAHLEPEVLIVDEVLAVGDAQFQKKCLGKMEDVGREGRSIIFVSHNLGVVQNLCTRGIFLQKGTLQLDGTAYEGVSSYLKSFESESTNILDRTDRRGKGDIKFAKISIGSGDVYNANTLSVGRSAKIVFHFTQVRVGMACLFTLYDQYGQAVIHFNSSQHGQEDIVDQQIGDVMICEIDELGLVPGRYRMNVALYWNGELQDAIESATSIDVENGEMRGRPIPSASGYGSVCFAHRWTSPV